MTYKIYAALHEETDRGWVWLVKDGFQTGDIVRLCSEDNPGRGVYCAYREIDGNFLTRYNERPHTRKIAPEKTYKPGEQMAISDRKRYKDLLVIGQWYRTALGVGDKEACCNVDVRKPWCSYWGHLRAACHHPDVSVRLGTRLGILGAWLGTSSLFLAILALVSRQWRGFWCATGLAIILLLVFGAVGLIAGRGIDRTKTVT